MSRTTVLVSGASIAGPSLALWLHRFGFEVTVVEKAPSVRPGGQPVDFKGRTHRTVLSRTGILDDVLAAQVGASDGRIVDARGRTVGTVPGAFSGGEINIPRGDLARILHERTSSTCAYVFGDSITALVETDDAVEVTFAHGAPRSFDLVVGADGIHSCVRGLVLGPESEHVRHLGYYYAQVAVAEDGDEMYNEPGRMVATSAGGDPALFVFASDLLEHDRDDVEQQKQLLREAYRGAGWRTPELLAQLSATSYFFFDSISRVSTDTYSQGRVALLGDAAWGNALGGFGTGLAVVGAYVLAGELALAGGDHRLAYRRYETRMRRYAGASGKVDAGRLLAPSTRPGIWARNRLFSLAPLLVPLMAVMDRFATDVDLADYEQLLRA